MQRHRSSCDQAHRYVGNAPPRAGATKAFDHFRRAVLASPPRSTVYHYELGHAAWHAGEARRGAARSRRRSSGSGRSRPSAGSRSARTLHERRPRGGARRVREGGAGSAARAAARLFIATRLGESGRGPAASAQAIALARRTRRREPRGGPCPRARSGTCCSYDPAQATKRSRPCEEAIRLNPHHDGTQRVLARRPAQDGEPERALASGARGRAARARRLRVVGLPRVRPARARARPTEAHP